MCFFFNDTATTEIYTLSLHDALPISVVVMAAVVPVDDEGDTLVGETERPLEDTPRDPQPGQADQVGAGDQQDPPGQPQDRKSTRLNSSHANISYAVFCLKKKKRSIET